MYEEEDEPENEAEKRLMAMRLEAQRKEALRHLVDATAYERLMNVRIANPNVYTQVVNLLLYMYKNRQLTGKVSEPQIKNLLLKITSKKNSSISIERK